MIYLLSLKRNCIIFNKYSFFVICYLIYLFSAAPSYSSINDLEKRNPEVSWAAHVLRIHKQTGQDIMKIVATLVEEREKGRVWTAEDFVLSDCPPAENFVDPRLGEIAQEIKEGFQNLINNDFDDYTLFLRISSEAKEGKPLHEITDLFLWGSQLDAYKDFLDLNMRIFIVNAIQCQFQWEYLLERSSKYCFQDFAQEIIDNLVAYLKVRRARLQTGDVPMMFEDTSSKYRRIDLHQAERARLRFEQLALLARSVVKGNLKVSELEDTPDMKDFCSGYQSLIAFLEGKQDLLQDIDIYIEENSPKVLIHHYAKLGYKENLILKKLEERMRVSLKRFEEKAPSRQQRRHKEREIKKKVKKHVPTQVREKFFTHIQEAIELHQKQNEKLLQEKHIDFQLRQEHKQKQKIEREMLLAEKRALLQKSERKYPEEFSFINNAIMTNCPSALSDSSSFVGIEPTIEEMEGCSGPLPKVKIKTRGKAYLSEPMEEQITSEKNEKEEDYSPIFTGTSQLISLHRELIGPYSSKFGWNKLERLATAFQMEITIPGHGGSHRGLKYNGLKTGTQAISLPVRMVYGCYFFNKAKKFFVEQCHLDENHVLLE